MPASMAMQTQAMQPPPIMPPPPMMPPPAHLLPPNHVPPPRLVDKAAPLQDGRDHSPNKDTVLAKDSHTDFVNKSSLEFVRTYKDGEIETVPLTTGPDGFALSLIHI